MLRCLLMMCLCILTACQAVADAPPNVVWIIADDLSPDLGCYGYEGVHTPNIDRLADEGALYTNAFVTAPVCSASRSAFITGVYQTTTGTHHHRTTKKKPLPAPVVPITDLFREAGYFVCNGNSNLKGGGKTDYNFTYQGKMYDGRSWSQRKPGQPFFAQVQIYEPHRDFIKTKDIHRADNVHIPAYYPDHPVTRADWANYLNSIEVLDRKVGAILDKLDREDLADNTVVVFFGDHGRPHYRDKQFIYDGGIHVPLIVRWPGKIEPGEVREEMVSILDLSAASLGVAGIDTPDWMDGQDMLADGFAGRDMVFAARDRMGGTIDRSRCVRTLQYKYIRHFRTDKSYTQISGYKELRYPGMALGWVLKERGEVDPEAELFWSDTRPAEELYDIVNDPDETRNLADDPAYTQTLTQLRAALDTWIDQSNDQGQFPEGTPEELQKTVDGSNEYYRKAMKKRGLSTDIDRNVYLKWWEKELGVE